MIKTLKILLILSLFITVSCSEALAQKKDSTAIGAITGLLRDSTHNYVMQSATVSVYRLSDGALLGYQLSNNFGRFRVKQLPLNTPLQAVATHLGYSPTQIKFTIFSDKQEIELGTLNMNRGNVELNEVLISAKPPMQMKGDTLEFNADAFKLDTNAVVEDMLRRLPGVTVWSDGIITVNGKKISRLLVDGKDFFGGDTKIALQNLSKSAVDKIQIYQNKKDPDPINPPTEMNVVLKVDKKNGYFGKFGGGYGTNRRYGADAMMGIFTPKIQLSAVAAANNVNKIADNLNTLMKFNSFKGEQIDNDYHSDFRKEGAQVFRSGGFAATYQLNKTEKVNADYFLNDADVKIQQDNQSLISTGSNGNLEQSSLANYNTNDFTQKLNTGYAMNSDKRDIYVNYKLNDVKNNSFNEQKMTSKYESNTQSTQFVQEENINKQRDIGLLMKFSNRRYNVVGTDRFKSVNFDLEYALEYQNANSESTRLTDFTADDISKNLYFNRNYKKNWEGKNHSIKTDFEDILGLLEKKIPYFQVNVMNVISIDQLQRNTRVGDLLGNNEVYSPNADLTNQISYKAITERPGLRFSKLYNRSLANRYQKVWYWRLFAEGEFSWQHNHSDKTFQTLERAYSNFLPAVNFAYQHSKFGYFEKNYSLNYFSSIVYPTMEQLAPLIDDANIYRIVRGNIALKPAYKQEVKFGYRYNNAEAKNPFSGSLDLGISATKDFISDSSYYDGLGRSVSYPVNVSGQRNAFVNGFIQKAVKIKDNQFQISLNSNVSLARNPLYIDGEGGVTKNIAANVATEFTYSYKGFLNANIGEQFSINDTEPGNGYRYSFRNWSTDLGFSLTLPKGVFFSTKLNFNKNSSSYTNNIYYTIWNADIGYRFLKGNNGELKFSALDLLRQNKNITNVLAYNSITTRNVNVLKQYFMIGVAFYPRKFGLGK